MMRIRRILVIVALMLVHTISGGGVLAETLTLPANTAVIEGSAFQNCTEFTGTLVIPETVYAIEDYAFAGCTGFTGIPVIPDSVKRIGAHAFDGCTMLNGKLTLPESMEVDATAFDNCPNLTVVQSSPETAGTVKIGVFEPLSGSNSAGGWREMLGMQYAVKETPTIEIDGAVYDVELICMDNGSSTGLAPSVAQKLVLEGVSVVLGSYGSGVSMAGSPIFENAGIPVIGVTCTNPMITVNNNHYFRICGLDPFQGTALANYAVKALEAKTAYCLAELGSDYDYNLATSFRQSFEALGGIVINESFPTNTTNFTSFLTNATLYGADVFFCPVSIDYSTEIIRQADSYGVTFPILGSDILDNNAVIDAAKDTDVKIITSTFYQEGASPVFDRGFKAWLNSDSDAKAHNGGDDTIFAESAMGYDAYHVALKALKFAGSTKPDAVLAALPYVTLNGVSGSITFDVKGDAIRDSAVIKTIDNAKGIWKFVTEQSIG